MTHNRLAGETSPYLLQHKDNPVHWYPWGDEARAAAKADHKPILLSIGYAACHWCHVMAHESFEAVETAALMNELFINIKVDREERPDLDAIYMSALALLGEPGGWPLTMFLTPDAKPFWGGTYFPPTSRYGRPGFPDLLRSIADAFERDGDNVARNAAALQDGLDKLAKTARRADGDALNLARIDEAAAAIMPYIDGAAGGTQGAPKFPQVPLFTLLWHAWRRRGDVRFRDAVTLTLDKMCQGGIYDHVGGGFARYSTDEVWLAPHFEKMLYDNAQLIDLLTLVWQQTGSPLYARRINETADWLVRDMVVPGGGFASTLDADSSAGEGAFYVWTEDQIDALLGSDAGLFKSHYDVTPNGNWTDDHGRRQTILNRTQAPELAAAATEQRLAGCRAVLLAARAKRPLPGLDDKVLADWNGMMIAALANAAAVFERPDWLAMARTAFAFIRDKHYIDGRLAHSWRGGETRGLGLLDDYAHMARAALALFQATADDAYVGAAEEFVAAVEHYFRDDNGGYFFTAADADDLITRTKTAMDNAVPAGNGVLTGVLARLWHLTGKDEYRDRAAAIAAAFAGMPAGQLNGLATLLTGYELLEDALQVVVAGPPDDTGGDALVRAVLEFGFPNLVLTRLTPGGGGIDLPAGHPAAGKQMIAGQATAYVCRGPVCGPPQTSAEELKEALSRNR